MEIFAYEMKYYNDSVEKSDIVCSSFEVEFFQEYMRIYNECFYEMRKALDVKPYNFLKEYNQIADRVKDIYLLVKHGEIIGSIACYDNEIDDLIVNKKFRRKGYGKQLLLWGMQHIREKAMPLLPCTLQSGIKMPLCYTRKQDLKLRMLKRFAELDFRKS